MTIPAGFAQCTLNWVGTALPFGAATVLGVEPDVSLDLTGIAGAMNSAINSSGILVHVNDACQIASVLVKAGPDASGPSATFPTGLPGQDSDPAASCNTAMLIHKGTALGGRKHAGRIYWPGLPQAKLNSNGTILAATLLTATDQWDDFRVACEANDIPLVLLHEGADDPDPVISLVPQPRAATQRRRLRG